MSEALKKRITEWLPTATPVHGALLRGVRFADASFIVDGGATDFPAAALEPAWRLVVDAFDVLAAQHLPPTRLSWVHERTVFHCVRRPEGMVLGIFLAKQSASADPVGLERLLNEFLALPA